MREDKFTLPCANTEDRFYVLYTNRLDPFRDGIDIGVENPEQDKSLKVLLETAEALELRDFLLEMYPLEG